MLKMNKNKIIPLIIFFLSIGGYPKKLPMITGIGFIEGMSYSTAAPPAELIIGIDITNDALYKLSHRDKTVKGGHLKKGANRVGIESRHLFKTPGTHIYILETKAGQFNFRYEITIEIKLDLPPPREISLEIETVKPFQYETEVYIDGRLAFKTRKKVYGAVSDSTKKAIKRAVEAGPAHYADPQNPAALSIPVLAIIRNILKKGKAPPAPKPRVISITFREKDKAGVQKKVRAELELHYRILKHPGG